MIEPEFHFDFGSPNAYLAHRVIPEIEARTGARFRYVPILLGGIFKLTNNRSPMESFADIPAKQAYMRTEMRRFLDRHNITDFRMNPHFPINTLTLMRTAIAATHEKCFAPVISVIFQNMWSTPRNMADPETLRTSLQEAGLDAEILLARAQSPEIKQELAQNTEASAARGTFGAPTFFVDTEMFFGKDQLRDAEEELVRINGNRRQSAT